MDNQIVFVVGNSRSGTTLLGRILGLNSHIYTFNELHFFEGLVSPDALSSNVALNDNELLSLLERLFTSTREGLFEPVRAGRYRDCALNIISKTDKKDPVSIYRAFLNDEARRQGKIIPCEQTPRYLFFLDEILHLIPEAKIINMVRDPRDVLKSQKNKWRRRFLGAKNIPLYEVVRAWANYHPYIIAKLWSSCILQAERYSYDPRVMSVRFEDLMDHPTDTVRAISHFLGVPFEERMLHVPQIGSSTGFDRPNEIGINTSRACNWMRGGLRQYEIQICEAVAACEMKKQGYDLVTSGRIGLRALPCMLHLFLKLSIAVPMNLSRTKNLKDTLRRRFLVRSAT